MSDDNPIKNYASSVAAIVGICVLMIQVSFWMGGRMESVNDKQGRIDRTLAPVAERVQRLEANNYERELGMISARLTQIEQQLIMLRRELGEKP